MKKLNLIGQKYGRLLVISEAGKNRFGQILWHCRCNCGNESIVYGNDLKNGHTKSCGCLKRAQIIERSTTHGLSRTVEYRAWKGAEKRCINSSYKSFHRYGGRGIEFRLPDFQEFFEHIGPRPSDKHSLDRIDTDKHYEIGNLRWATTEIQDRNKSNNRYLTYQDETLCLAEWTEKLGFSKSLISKRLKHGWSVEKALSTPPRGRRFSL